MYTMPVIWQLECTLEDSSSHRYKNLMLKIWNCERYTEYTTHTVLAVVFLILSLLFQKYLELTNAGF